MDSDTRQRWISSPSSGDDVEQFTRADRIAEPHLNGGRSGKEGSRPDRNRRSLGAMAFRNGPICSPGDPWVGLNQNTTTHQSIPDVPRADPVDEVRLADRAVNVCDRVKVGQVHGPDVCAYSTTSANRGVSRREIRAIRAIERPKAGESRRERHRDRHRDGHRDRRYDPSMTWPSMGTTARSASTVFSSADHKTTETMSLIHVSNPRTVPKKP